VHKAIRETRKKAIWSVALNNRTFHQTQHLNRMKPTIEVIIAPTGEIKIDAIGFKGADCEKATSIPGRSPRSSKSPGEETRDTVSHPQSVNKRSVNEYREADLRSLRHPYAASNTN